MTSLKQLLSRLKELHELGSKAPFFVEPCNSGEECWCRVITNKKESYDNKDVIVPSGAIRDRDAILFTEVRNALPLLLEVIETQREALEWYSEGMGNDSDDAEAVELHAGTMSHRWMDFYGKTARQALARCEKVIQEGMK